MQWIFLSYILLMFKWQRAGRFQTICIPTTIVLSWPRGDPTCPWTKHESPSQSKTKALSIILKKVWKHINYTRSYLPYSKHTTSRPTFSLKERRCKTFKYFKQLQTEHKLTLTEHKLSVSVLKQGLHREIFFFAIIWILQALQNIDTCWSWIFSRHIQND